MKTFAQIIAIATLTTSSIFANPIAGETNVNANKTNNFAIGMYQSVGTLDMHLTLDKVVGKAVTVTIKDKDGKVIHNERIAKSARSYHGKFDLQALNDGTYSVEITDGTEKITRTININAAKPQEVTRTIVVE
ncbi:DUF3244 domain-containing protein [Arcicella aquatica]|uniref:DUF3244 domain-containing protein n=1 Tax=Arcicella aquatica TaxID=217141 RepID=A0ABU5QND0_9BACT|nr:DUF3244 domain-containing protein [Arcicella aquatica]MEA5258528.1 DUF3244 domain-containing protein [Arcicella aquatica]